MGSIILRDVGVAAAGKPLFQDLSFTLADGDRLGLVAGNGAGKSTLLRCLAGLAEPSAGSITTSRGLTVALVAQDMPATLLDLPLADATREFQKQYIQRHIQRQRGNMTAAAEQLGLHRSNLYRKMGQLGMDAQE